MSDPSNMYGLNNRVALVTGGSSGIGLAIALELARHGALIVSVSKDTPERIAEALEKIRAISPNSEAHQGDVTSREEMEAVVKGIMERHGRIDVLINNAGITRDNLLLRMSDEEWDRVLQINLTSIFRITQIVIKPMLKARWGRIVNIASVVGLTGNAGQANYTAAKAGLMGFSRTVAREVASRNITVNCVAPGFIATAMTDKLKPEARDAILAQIPLASMGQPEDVANAVCFLASDKARYITGETINVNGGMYMP